MYWLLGRLTGSVINVVYVVKHLRKGMSSSWTELLTKFISSQYLPGGVVGAQLQGSIIISPAACYKRLPVCSPKCYMFCIYPQPPMTNTTSTCMLIQVAHVGPQLPMTNRASSYMLTKVAYVDPRLPVTNTHLYAY